MRRPEYLSPSAIAKWAKSREEYYLHYLTDNVPPREPQTRAMAIGSAFDAFVKNYLHAALFGKSADARFELGAIFEAQVESPHRDWAMVHGLRVFTYYKECGALADFLEELKTGTNQRFEFELRGSIGRSTVALGVDSQESSMARIVGSGITHRGGSHILDCGDVVLLGKPDVAYVNRDGVHVIRDWKVNGYCSRHPTSPMKGYLKLREQGKPSKQHGECVIGWVGGMPINIGTGLEKLNEDWARQLAIYAWLCGEPVGGEFVIGIDQIVCKPFGGGEFPDLRVAEHKLRIGGGFQHVCYDEAVDLWEIVHSDHIFRDKSKEESLAHCKLLDQMNEEYWRDNSPEGEMFRTMTGA